MPTNRITRRRLLASTSLTLAATACLPLPALAAAAPDRKRPNFVFIFADDLGWGDLRCYGNNQIKTPNLDALARRGTLFTQFYVNGSVCSPSRTAIMTSHYPARHRIHGHLATHQLNESRAMPDWLDPDVHTVTSLLKDAGYRTGHFGKWHLGSGAGAPDPGAYGIDEHITCNSSGPTFPQSRNNPYFRAQSTELIVDESIKFIEKHRDEPFYLNVWTLLPHATLHPTDEQMEPFENLQPRGVPYRGARTIYYASVADLDKQIGRLIDRIDQLGLAENTVIVFSSDNGPEDIHIGNAVHSAYGDTGPFRGRKRSLYEGGIRLPFIVRWTGHTPAGNVDNDSIIAGVDWLPTACSLAGVKLPADLKPDGMDMSPAFLGKPTQREHPLMWQWRFRVHGDMTNRCPMLAIRDGKWKLLMNPDNSRIELYDIVADPTEVDNLAARNPQLVSRLSKPLLQWHNSLPEGPIEKMAGSNSYPWPGSNPQKPATSGAK